MRLRSALMSRSGMFALLTVALLLWRLPYYGKIVLDDPFITFRYAQNLADHGAFVFNPGENVLATTTPIYGLLLTPIAALHFSLPLAASVINLLFEIAALYVLGQILSEFKLSERQQWIAFGITGVLFFTNRAMSIASQSGMETPLFTLLNLLTILCILRRRYRWGAVAGAATCLTRPDGIFVLVLLGIVILVRERRLPIAEILISLGIALPWVAYATLTYGSFIPHSITAKNAIERLWFANLSLKFSLVFYAPLRFFGIFIVLPILWAVYRLIQPERRLPGLVLLTFTLMQLAYMVLPSNLGFDWYFAPLYTMLDLLAGLGVVLFVNRRAIAWVCAIGIALGMIYSSVGNYLSVAENARIWRDGIFQVIDYLHEHAPPNSVIQSTNIGLLGYYSGLYILDPLGLASPQVVPLMADATSLTDLQIRVAAHFHPDYIISFGSEKYADYEQVAVFPTSSVPLVVYRSQS
ncbi:MAG: hypothetical protein ABI700_05775 [Chloroflexota bacterium]